MRLSDISFPVFKLGKRKPNEEEGVHFYLSSSDEDGIVKYNIQIIDDKNIPGKSLASRRLYMLNKNYSLFKIKQGIFFIADLLKLTKGATWFIDSNGKVFQYIKTRRVSLIFKKIKEIFPIKTGGVIIEVYGIPYRFKSLFKPLIEQKYAGLLYFDNSYVLYGFYDKLYDKTTRMI